MKTTRFLLAAGLMLAIALTLSCSEKCGDKSTSEDNVGFHYWIMNYNYDGVSWTSDEMPGLRSVRCLKD